MQGRTQILLRLVLQGKAEILKKIIACKGDEKKEDAILEKYK